MNTFGIFSIVALGAAAIGLTGVFVAGVPDRDLRGVWVSAPYGQILSISAFRIQAYSMTSISCFRERGFLAQLDLIRELAGVSMEASETGLNIFVDGAVEPISYTRSALPERCQNPTHFDAGPRHTFDVFWTAFHERYPFFEVHNVDWMVRKDMAPKSDDVSDAELSAILKHTIAGLDDGHVILHMAEQGTYSPSVRPTWLEQGVTSAALWDTAISSANIPVSKTQDISIQYGLRPDHIGYIAIKEMEVQKQWGKTSGDTALSAFAPVAEALNSAKGIIVDVRYNPGGSDSVALALASVFADQPRTLFTKWLWDAGAFSSPFVASIKPNNEVRLTPPVVLLTGSLTGSAAEVFTLAMREFPNVTTMGTSTAGGLSDVLEFTLPNGWRIGMSAQKYTSADGKAFEGKGIPPDIGFASEGTDEALDGAIQYLKER
ncbi:S41 family peptidase [Pelagimonas varians]|uniref:Putative CtpA-like serine protease n=1 Tax=Pelagimonas varians TaxID=696760 RepID=A0A238L2J9_9RHOB|nr:S41 family peptidase [Pelagimonas varians]PYG26719.1 peptidase S41-like protein [Pelagimonas varians]SMX49168.1 putative CtpA-like serine protease [Pelagimonas varians]